jgi:hypothetical protein
LDNGISMEVAKIRAQLAAEREQNRAAAAERGRLAALAAAKRHKELSNSALAMRAPRPRFIAKVLTEQERRDKREAARVRIDAPGWGGGNERTEVESDAGMLAVLSQVHAPVKKHHIFDPTEATRNSSSLVRDRAFDPHARTIPTAPSFAAAVKRSKGKLPRHWRGAEDTYDASDDNFGMIAALTRRPNDTPTELVAPRKAGAPKRARRAGLAETAHAATADRRHDSRRRGSRRQAGSALADARVSHIAVAPTMQRLLEAPLKRIAATPRGARFAQRMQYLATAAMPRPLRHLWNTADRYGAGGMLSTLANTYGGIIPGAQTISAAMSRTARYAAARVAADASKAFGSIGALGLGRTLTNSETGEVTLAPSTTLKGENPPRHPLARHRSFGMIGALHSGVVNRAEAGDDEEIVIGEPPTRRAAMQRSAAAKAVAVSAQRSDFGMLGALSRTYSKRVKKARGSETEDDEPDQYDDVSRIPCAARTDGPRRVMHPLNPRVPASARAQVRSRCAAHSAGAPHLTHPAPPPPQLFAAATAPRKQYYGMIAALTRTGPVADAARRGAARKQRGDEDDRAGKYEALIPPAKESRAFHDPKRVVATRRPRLEVDASGRPLSFGGTLSECLTAGAQARRARLKKKWPGCPAFKATFDDLQASAPARARFAQWRTSKKDTKRNGGARAIDELMEVNLDDNAIDDASSTQLAAALRRNGSVTSLSIARGCVRAKGCAAIAAMLRHNTVIDTLDLSRNHVGDGGCAALRRALRKTSTLTCLSLAGNAITDDGCAALARGLARNQSVLLLDLASNAIGDDGCVVMAVALASGVSGRRRSSSAKRATDRRKDDVALHRTLELNLIDNPAIGARGIKALALLSKTHINIDVYVDERVQ